MTGEVSSEMVLPASELHKEKDMSITATPIAIETGTWNVDPAHSRVGFSIRHMGIATIRGEFTEFAGVLEVGQSLSSIRASGSVNVASIFTNEPHRDEHLRSADFFDAAQHPTLTFVSNGVEAVDEERFRITGSLTIHGVTNPVVLDAVVQGTDVDPWGNERVGLEVTGEISRGDYGMSFNQALGSGRMLVGDKVKLTIDVSAIKQS
jgi:polyisoprenoid-binding protein YceI